MGVKDIEVIKNGYGVQEFVTEDWATSSETATIKAGNPVKKNTNSVIPLATGEMRIGSGIFVGIADDESTETQTVNGIVTVEMVGPGTILRGKATTAANMDTASELLGIKMDYVNFDLTSTTFSIDEDEGDNPNNNGLCIIDGDIDKGTLDVVVHLNITLFGAMTGQTMD